MADFAVLACDKATLSKDRMKSYYDKLAKSLPEFSPGDMVLINIYYTYISRASVNMTEGVGGGDSLRFTCPTMKVLDF